MRKTIPTFLLLVLLFSATVPDASAAAGQEHLAAILVVDNSGSMKASDPDGLRYTGVRLLISLLDPGDAFGLVTFATGSQIVTDGLLTLDSPEMGAKVLDGILTPAADGFTDVRAALEDARDLIRGSDLKNKKVVIVLLTDGKPEIQNAYPEYEQETLKLAQALKVPILAIALTQQGRTGFLERLAGVTGGSVTPAADASDLLGAYLQVLGQIKDRTVVGGGMHQASGSLYLEPSLSPYVNSVTFVITKPDHANLEFLATDGVVVGADRSRDSRYSIFYLEDPAGGEYAFRVQGGGRAQAWAVLRSRLRLVFVFPATIHPLQQDMPIVVNLLEETPDGDFIKVIGAVNFSALVRAPDGHAVSLDLFYDDGTHGDEVPGDGDFTRILPGPLLEGGYQIWVEGWKGMVQVETGTQVIVERFPSLVVDAPPSMVEVRDAPVELRAHFDTTIPPQGDVVATILSPSGARQEVALSGDGAYRAAQFLPLESGPHRVTFETRNLNYMGAAHYARAERSFEVLIVPTVDVFVSNLMVPSACLSSPKEAVLSLSLLSNGGTELHFTASPGWDVAPQTRSIDPGRQEISLRLAAEEALKGGVYPVEVQVTGDGLDIRPERGIKVEVRVPGLYDRCRTPVNIGVIALVTGLGGALFLRRARRASLPPLVSGTLRHWVIGSGAASAMEIDLTAFGKNTLMIGSGKACDVVILQAGLLEQQARVFAERTTDGVDVYLEPLGEVKKGYSLQNSRFRLQHGDTFCMGAHEYQYLSDHGE